MKKLIKQIVKKGIAWYVDPLYRENEALKNEIQSLYKMLDGVVSGDTVAAQSVHGGGPFAHSIVPPAGTRIWIYGIGNAGPLAARYVKECTDAKLMGLIDDAFASTQNSYQGDAVVSLEEAISMIAEGDWVLFCGEGQVNSLTYRKLQATLRTRNVPARFLHFWDLDVRPILRRVTPDGYDGRLISRVCTYEDFHNPLFSDVIGRLGVNNELSTRKVWEWAYIVRVLESFNCLKPGAKGLGFAVGTEPLPSYFASLDVEVLATDLSPDETAAQAWIETNQHSGDTIDALFKENLCTRAKFDNNVSFRYVDMNSVPDELQGYDFCWSSCAIEHVGSLEQSKQFLKRMLRCLKPGGVAVHTTEFNLSSDVDTMEYGSNIIFRKKDIEEIKEYFLSLGCEMETSYLRGNTEEDNQIDIWPTFSPGAPRHVNLALCGYASTSFAIVVRKPS